jgi:hypothetical protein
LGGHEVCEHHLAGRAIELPEATRLGDCQLQAGHLEVFASDALEEESLGVHVFLS